MLEAFARYRRDVDPDCRLALAGDMTWEAGPLKQRITELGLDAAVSRLGYVPHYDLPAIYGGPRFLLSRPCGKGSGFRSSRRWRAARRS
jgi:hypothetical protein